MPTVLDTLTLELGWDVKKFLEGAKQTQERVRVQREDFERQGKIFEGMIGSLTAVVGRLAAAFLSVEAAINAIKMTKGLSAAGTEFSNLAESVGLSVEQLGKWEQALQRVGGKQGEAQQAFAFQQQELQKRHGPSGQAPAFLSWMQRLGLNPESYYNAETKTYDLDRLNRDLGAALQRQNRSPAERTMILREFGFTSPAAQRLFAGDLNAQLARQSDTTMTKAQEETFRRLHAQWTDLGNAASAVARDLTVYLERPITRLLDLIKKVTKDADDALKTLQGGTYVGPFSTTPTWDNPLGLSRPPIYRAPVQNPSVPRFFRSDPGAPAASSPAARPLVPWSSSGPSETLPGGAVMVPPRTGIRSGPSPSPVPAPAAPGSFEDRWSPLIRPQSRVDPSILDLPQFAMAGGGGASAGSVTNNTRSNVSIGAMSFNSRASDTEMGMAPADVSRQLSVAQFAVQSNQSIL